MSVRGRRLLGFVLGSVALLCGPFLTPSRAAICGDANQDDAVTVTDGVACLRIAAGLETSASGDCDMNGDDAVTVSDGVSVLRNAASLSSVLSCASEIGTVFGDIQKSQGLGATPIRLNLEQPPDPGTVPTLGMPVGFTGELLAGRSISYSVTYDVGPNTGGAKLLLALRDTDSNFLLQGFYELPLESSAGIVELLLDTHRITKNVRVEFYTQKGTERSAVQSSDLMLSTFGFGTINNPRACTGDVDQCLCLDGGAKCTSDRDCACDDNRGCTGGVNLEKACSFNSECPDAVCLP